MSNKVRLSAIQPAKYRNIFNELSESFYQNNKQLSTIGKWGLPGVFCTVQRMKFQDGISQISIVKVGVNLCGINGYVPK